MDRPWHIIWSQPKDRVLRPQLLRQSKRRTALPSRDLWSFLTDGCQVTKPCCLDDHGVLWVLLHVIKNSHDSSTWQSLKHHILMANTGPNKDDHDTVEDRLMWLHACIYFAWIFSDMWNKNSFSHFQKAKKTAVILQFFGRSGLIQELLRWSNTHRIHVWYIYLHVVDVYGKSR